MTGSSELAPSVRVDAAGRGGRRRADLATRATSRSVVADEADVAYQPPIAIRMRPLAAARRLWANAAGASSRLGMDANGKRVDFVTEPKTGLKLPGEYCTKGKSSDCTPLCGMGVRVKRIAGIGVKVYACGLYVDPGAARRAVGDKHVGRRPADVAKDQSLYDAVLRADDVEKTVRLVFARDIDSAKIRDALSERLRPALGAGSPSLAQFESFFDGLTFKKGQSLTFSAVGGKLHTTVLGKSAGVIADPKLCRALFDAYLGKDPVVPSAKQSLGEQLAGSVTG